MKFPGTLLPQTETTGENRKAVLDLLAKVNRLWDDLTLNPLTLAGPLTLTGNLSVGGALSVTGAVATGPLTVTGAATVSGLATLGSLSITGTSLLTGAVTFSTTALHTGTATFTLAPVFSAMTSGSVLFAGTSGLLSQDNANFNWDATNKLFKVWGQADGTRAIFRQTGATNNPALYIQTTEATDLVTLLITGSTGLEDLAINVGGSVRQFIDGTTGNVGIGTASPAFKLHVLDASLGNGAAAEVFRIGGGADATLGPVLLAMGFYPSATGTSRWAYIGAGDSGAWRNLVLNPYGGNVGIGMTPAYTLDVTGDFRVSAKFGCNTKNPQGAYASGGLPGYTAGLFGASTAIEFGTWITLVTNIRAALVANGIMS